MENIKKLAIDYIEENGLIDISLNENAAYEDQIIHLSDLLSGFVKECKGKNDNASDEREVCYHKYTPADSDGWKYCKNCGCKYKCS